MAESGLIVRRSERFEISLPARIRVASYHTEGLNFAKGVCNEDRWIDVDLIDFAAGGLGFITRIYLPRNVDLEIEIPDFHNGTHPAVLQSLVRVQRVQMTDRRPAYQIGCSFIDLNEETNQQIDSLIDRLSGLSGDEHGEGF